MFGDGGDADNLVIVGEFFASGDFGDFDLDIFGERGGVLDSTFPSEFMLMTFRLKLEGNEKCDDSKASQRSGLYPFVKLTLPRHLNYQAYSISLNLQHLFLNLNNPTMSI